MKTMTKREQIKEYNLDNPGYHITGIKSMTAGERLYYELSGDGAMVATTENGLFVLMPLKPEKRHK
jgi:hypothetical protein